MKEKGDAVFVVAVGIVGMCITAYSVMERSFPRPFLLRFRIFRFLSIPYKTAQAGIGGNL